MFEKLLYIIREGGELSPTSLSQQMGIHPSLINAMLDHMVRLGMLQEVRIDNSCERTACGGCNVSERCLTGEIKVWASKSRP